MRSFFIVLAHTLVVGTKNNFVWFALTFWIFLQTKSVLSTSLLGGLFLVISSVTSFWFGSLVDHYPKKKVLLGSNLVTLFFFTVGMILYFLAPPEVYNTVASPLLWVLAGTLLAGVVSGNLYNIVVPTLVPQLVPASDRDKANGMFGTVGGVSFTITSVASGLVLAFGGMEWVLTAAVFLTVVALIHVLIIQLPDTSRAHDVVADKPEKKSIDVLGTIRVIREIPGLAALIIFGTFNNFLGGVFMALMDAYGLSLVPVHVWGMLWGGLSLGFIVGGLWIAKKGLGEQPLRTMFRINLITWTACIFMAIQPSIWLLAMGILVWICLMPFIEATEQTVLQKVVPEQRLGRVIGFAQSVEQAAAPVTSFLIGPITQFIFIPLMTDGAGAAAIGSWYGVGPGRGIALVFSLAGIIGLLVTLVAMRSRQYLLLARTYEDGA